MKLSFEQIKSIVKGVFDHIHIARFASEREELAIEAYPVNDITQLNHPIHAICRIKEMIEEPHGAHRIHLFCHYVVVERLHTIPNALITRLPIVFHQSFETAQYLVRFRPESRLRIPVADIILFERIVQQSTWIGLFRRKLGDYVVSELPVGRMPC